VELLIKAPTPQVFEWNYEEIKAAAVAKAAEYKGVVYETADEAAMKKDKADLNRIINQIEDERKRIKKECMAPYDAFERQVKDVLLPLREAVAFVEKGLSDIEASYRQKKRDAMQALYDEVYQDVASIIPFDKTVREEYYKKAYTDKKLEKTYRDVAEQVHADLQTIKGFEEKYHSAAIHAYMPSFSLADAQAEVFRLQALDKQLEERKRAEELRKQQLAEVREKAKENMGPAPEPAPSPAPAPVPAPAVPPVQEPAPTPVAEEPILTFGPIICKGTRAQLLGLAQYIKANNIMCTKVEG